MNEPHSFNIHANLNDFNFFLVPGRTFMSAGRGTPFSDPSTGLSSVSDSAGGGRGGKKYD